MSRAHIHIQKYLSWRRAPSVRLEIVARGFVAPASRSRTHTHIHTHIPLSTPPKTRPTLPARRWLKSRPPQSAHTSVLFFASKTPPPPPRRSQSALRGRTAAPLCSLRTTLRECCVSLLSQPASRPARALFSRQRPNLRRPLMVSRRNEMNMLHVDMRSRSISRRRGESTVFSSFAELNALILICARLLHDEMQ
jgi:hypothetical protein